MKHGRYRNITEQYRTEPLLVERGSTLLKQKLMIEVSPLCTHFSENVFNQI